MEFTGQATPYAVSRPLSIDERDRQLKQKENLNTELYHQLSVIEINSNWLEVVDKYFFDKGALTTAWITQAAFTMFGLLTGFYYGLSAIASGNAEGWYVFIVNPILILFAWYTWRVTKKEINYTHYPIRFNRKTRMVHVFRQDGTVLSAKWEKIFFTQIPVTYGMWDMVGHVLDEDGVTVRETFGLPACAMGSWGRERAKGYWEFIRRYMEEGPASVSDVISGCLPIKDKKETLAFSFERIAASLGSYLNAFILFYYIFYPGRMIAMHFSKIPRWPAEIEAQCQRLDGHDPFFKDASMNA
ncbi:DUF6708 domain-containing protein [Chromobacterium sphagni]|uniref:DUF6708 domain-containing protein n=1 Tax=Chromobacterium sphagni TaxID=1903179 RepID=A0ABX3CDD0_9NEIS|nr:DUF6708 domain-containing protein [Chromobacterium sphagni]OHX20101.1 hypothetical protein BI344_06200 [Chromobacterium sphagni]